MPGPVVADTVTQLTAAHAGQVVVTGSHGGLIAAAYAAHGRVRAAIFNDAGRGRDDAGVAGLAALARVGIPACAVDHLTARIGDAADTFAHGVVSLCNADAAAMGVATGMSCADAAARLATAPWRTGDVPFPPQSRREFAPAAQGARRCAAWTRSDWSRRPMSTACSSSARTARCTVATRPVRCPSRHVPRSSTTPDADCGEAGLSRLPILAERAMPAGAVDYRSARIGDAGSMWETGIVSAVNAPAQARGVRAGMRVQAAAGLLREVARGPR